MKDTDETTIDVEDIPHEDLLHEWQDIYEKLRTPVNDPDEDVRLNVRKRELWNEMKERTDAQPPECPNCGEHEWSQSMGNPKVCANCDLNLGEEHEDLVKRVDGYWRTVKSPGGDNTSDRIKRIL